MVKHRKLRLLIVTDSTSQIENASVKRNVGSGEEAGKIRA
jgi:hypothetical protein